MNRSQPRNRASTVAGAGLGALATTLIVAAPAGAHTGLPAGGAVDGIAHPVLGLDHLLAMVAVGVLATTAGTRRVGWSIPLGFVVAMLAGALVGLSGASVGAAEVVVAASVLVLGLLISTTLPARGVWLPILAAAFGAAHGYTHGAELPAGAGAGPVAYVAGFVLATAALHLAGTALGFGLRRMPAARVAAGTFLATAGLGLLLVG